MTTQLTDSMLDFMDYAPIDLEFGKKTKRKIIPKEELNEKEEIIRQKNMIREFYIKKQKKFGVKK